MRAVFFGTPEIAVPALQALAQRAHVTAVVCQPDRPAGRGLSMREPAVKTAARALGLEVHQPTRIKTPEFAQWLAQQQPDVALVMAYGRILPPAVLQTPRAGCLNLHASLLPKYRGAAPITWAVVHGEKRTGVCLMQMDAGMDTGPVLACHELVIGPDETAGELSERMAELGAQVVHQELERAVNGELKAQPQDESQATYAPMLKKEDGRINWQQPARAVHDHVRGMTPWPGAYTTAGGKLLKVHRSSVCQETEQLGAPGQVLVADKTKLVVACGQGALELVTVQPEGRKAMAGRELVMGRGVRTGDRLGA